MVIREIDDLQKAVPVAGTLGAGNWNKVKAWIKNAEVLYFRPLLGKDLLDELDTALEATPSEKQQELIDSVTFALGNLAMMDFMPANMSIITDGGNVEPTSDSGQSARQWVTIAQVNTMCQAGFRRLEDIVVFLEENLSDFDSWTSSWYFTEGRKRFVPNALVFNRYYEIAESGWTYYHLLASLKTVEDGPVKSLLGSAYFTELKDKLALADPGLNPVEEQLLERLQAAIAPLTMAKALPRLAVEIGPQGVTLRRTNTSQSITAFEAATADEKAELVKAADAQGKAALEEAKAILYANADVFTTWKASGAYVAEPVDRFEQDPELGHFVSGIR